MSTNGGAMQVTTEVVDVTNLSNAGHHVWDPAANTDIDNPQAVSVIGQEDPTYDITWDHVNGDRFHVTEVNDTGDGTGGVQDVASGTDIGEVKLRVEGRR
ncbi:hypothetical protein [Haloarcula pellucida]|uniref:Uncharacterized protein n=1 Tax=Haloarcula pellucida TaxID=1427151 RepID=A0A830GR65_9EURY|nr:hypothetical protein [Halomicroarcula pellucida]MBX0350479.1 hypothetical protein [Halomicroarcula pellucida]GGO03523.1 hypothetical protein GCM10009030_39250 [Halomicroarcula pellucida]